MLVQQSHLSVSLRRKLLLVAELRREPGDLRILVARAVAERGDLLGELVLLRLRRGKRCRQIGDLALQVAGVRLLHLQHVGEFGDLRIEPRQGRILALDLLAEEKLRQHEQRQKEDDDQQQARQCVDESRPIVGDLATAHTG